MAIPSKLGARQFGAFKESSSFGGQTGIVVVNSDGSNVAGGSIAAIVANGQVALSVAEATVVEARATRRSVLIRNLDVTISVYIGIATVSAANGMLLKAGESITLYNTALIQGIAASGTPIVAYIEEYG